MQLKFANKKSDIRANPFVSFVLWSWLVIVLTGFMIPVPVWSQTDTRYAFPVQPSVSPKGVNFQTGRFSYNKTDISIGPLSLVRSWADASHYRRVSTFGNSTVNISFDGGWSHNYAQGVTYNSIGNYFSVFADSKRYKFSQGGGGELYSQDKSALGALLQSTSTQYILTSQSGAVYFFAKKTFSSGSIPDGVINMVEYPDGSRINYGYRENSSSIASFQIHSIISNRGYAIIIDYNASGNIQTICGFNTVVQFVSNTSTCAGATLKTSYGYSPDGSALMSVTDPLGRVTQFIGYGGGPLCVTLPNSSICEIQNVYGTLPTDPFFPGTNIQPAVAGPDMVRIQTTANGDVWRYDYELGENPQDVPIITGRPRYTQSRMAGPEGQSATLDYDRGVLVDLNTSATILNFKYPQQVFTGQIQNSLSPVVFDYHAVTPALVTSFEGNREYYFYDARGNVTFRLSWPKGAAPPTSAATGGPLISTTDVDLARCCILPDFPAIVPGGLIFGQAFLPSFPAGSLFPTGCGAGPADAKRCDKPVNRTDERGNVTDYTYDPAHGGVLTETASAVNGIRPQTRYVYAQRYAWIKNSSGAFVQATTPIWVLTQKSYCKAGAAAGAGCAVAGDEVKTAYDYGPDSGPNNLLLRGTIVDAGGLNLRTCYSYDWRGNKVSETSPRSGLAVCP